MLRPRALSANGAILPDQNAWMGIDARERMPHKFNRKYRSRQVSCVLTANARERRPLPDLRVATSPWRGCSRLCDLIITWQAAAVKDCQVGVGIGGVGVGLHPPTHPNPTVNPHNILLPRHILIIRN